MAGFEIPSVVATFAEVLALGAAEQVELFHRAHRRSVSGRYEEVVTLTVIEESRAYEAAGCSSIQQFGARVADYHEHQVSDMLRVGRTLKECPELDAAFRSGRLSWSKVRTLNPVVTRENAAEWIKTAEDKSTAWLEKEVGKRREPNGKPWMVPMPEVANGVFFMFRTLCERLREKLGEPGMPDGECAGVLFAMAAWALEQHPEEALGALGHVDVDRGTATATSTAMSTLSTSTSGDAISVTVRRTASGKRGMRRQNRRDAADSARACRDGALACTSRPGGPVVGRAVATIRNPGEHAGQLGMAPATERCGQEQGRWLRAGRHRRCSDR